VTPIGGANAGSQQIPTTVVAFVAGRWRMTGVPAKRRKLTMQKTATAKKIETVSLKDLGTALAESHSMPKAQVNAMLTAMVEDLGKHLKKGKRIRISGLGILQVRKRAARMGRNPGTGEAIKIKASKKIAFRASKDLKEAVM
jgi:DNA-binding protein HU-beta